MNELLQKLLEAEVLSEDTKTELEQAFKTQLDEAITAAKDEAAADVRAELTEQWVKERDTLVEAIDSKVGEFLEEEITELKSDIESFRDLEAEYATKIVEAKASMGDELKSDLTELVEKIDAFLEIRLAAEIEELHEDIMEVRKNEFGRKVFEAFTAEFADNYADDDSAAASLREKTERLTDVEAQLQESERVRNDLERTIKMESVLEPLAGRQRDIMEAILRKVDTTNLEEGYKTFIGRVLRESEDTTVSEDAKSEKEDKVLAEGEEKKGKKTPVVEGVVLTGDKKAIIEESVEVDADAESRKAYLRKLAGIV